MSDIYPVNPDFAAGTRIDKARYERDYTASVQDADAFWAEAANRLDWYRKPSVIKDVSFDLDDFRIRWFADGELNASVNCLDRQLAQRGDKTALVWEADSPDPRPEVELSRMHESAYQAWHRPRELGGAGTRHHLLR